MCATHLLIMLGIIKFASVVYEQHNFRHNLTFDLIVTLTLGVGKITLVRYTPSHHVLPFCEVLLNLLQ